MRRRSVGRHLLIALAAVSSACALFPPEPPQPVAIAILFGGYAAHLASTTTTLMVEGSAQSFQWSAQPSGSFPAREILILPGDSLHAIARVMADDGSLAAEARLGRLIEPGYRYALSFRVGGVNPDRQGFCHQPPSRTALATSPSDTLFLWWNAQPTNAVC